MGSKKREKDESSKKESEEPKGPPSYAEVDAAVSEPAGKKDKDSKPSPEDKPDDKASVSATVTASAEVKPPELKPAPADTSPPPDVKPVIKDQLDDSVFGARGTVHEYSRQIDVPTSDSQNSVEQTLAKVKMSPVDLKIARADVPRFKPLIETWEAHGLLFTPEIEYSGFPTYVRHFKERTDSMKVEIARYAAGFVLAVVPQFWELQDDMRPGVQITDALSVYPVKTSYTNKSADHQVVRALVDLELLGPDINPVEFRDCDDHARLIRTVTETATVPVMDQFLDHVIRSFQIIEFVQRSPKYNFLEIVKALSHLKRVPRAYRLQKKNVTRSSSLDLQGVVAADGQYDHRWWANRDVQPDYPQVHKYMWCRSLNYRLTHLVEFKAPNLDIEERTALIDIINRLAIGRDRRDMQVETAINSLLSNMDPSAVLRVILRVMVCGTGVQIVPTYPKGVNMWNVLLFSGHVTLLSLLHKFIDVNVVTDTWLKLMSMFVLTGPEYFANGRLNSGRILLVPSYDDWRMVETNTGQGYVYAQTWAADPLGNDALYNLFPVIQPILARYGLVLNPVIDDSDLVKYRAPLSRNRAIMAELIHQIFSFKLTMERNMQLDSMFPMIWPRGVLNIWGARPFEVAATQQAPGFTTIHANRGGVYVTQLSNILSNLWINLGGLAGNNTFLSLNIATAPAVSAIMHAVYDFATVYLCDPVQVPFDAGLHDDGLTVKEVLKLDMYSLGAMLIGAKDTVYTRDLEVAREAFASAIWPDMSRYESIYGLDIVHSIILRTFSDFLAVRGQPWIQSSFNELLEMVTSVIKDYFPGVSPQLIESLAKYSYLQGQPIPSAFPWRGNRCPFRLPDGYDVDQYAPGLIMVDHVYIVSSPEQLAWHNIQRGGGAQGHYNVLGVDDAFAANARLVDPRRETVAEKVDVTLQHLVGQTLGFRAGLTRVNLPIRVGIRVVQDNEWLEPETMVERYLDDIKDLKVKRVEGRSMRLKWRVEGDITLLVMPDIYRNRDVRLYYALDGEQIENFFLNVDDIAMSRILMSHTYHQEPNLENTGSDFDAHTVDLDVYRKQLKKAEKSNEPSDNPTPTS